MDTMTLSKDASSEPAIDEHEVTALIEVIDDRKVLDPIVEMVWRPDGLPRIRALIIEHVRGAISDLESEVIELEKAARETRAEALTKRREQRAFATRRASRFQADADHHRTRIERLRAIVDRFAA
jgi:hypothetical protein